MTAGRLWPQASAGAYASMLASTQLCRGRTFGRLWVEITGKARREPLLVLQSHPAFSHELMHDVADPFSDYLQVCYVEMPGSVRNPLRARPHQASNWRDLLQGFDRLLAALGKRRIHLLAHLTGAATALKLAWHRPRAVGSLILMEPELDAHAASASLRASQAGELLRQERLSGPEREELAATLLRAHWNVEAAQEHRSGLAALLAPGLAPALLARDGLGLSGAGRYSRLRRLAAPALVFTARQGRSQSREDALFLHASLPGSELVPLETGGGDWAPWMSGGGIANRAVSFKARAESEPRRRPRWARRPSGQPLALITALFALITWGLVAGLAGVAYQPPYMQRVVPLLLGGLLPLLWLIVPRRLPLGPLLAVRPLGLGPALAALLAGLLLGLAAVAVLFSLGGGGALLLDLPEAPWEAMRRAALSLPLWVPGGLRDAAASLPARMPEPLRAVLSSLPAGSPGRPYMFVAVLPVVLLVFGVVANLMAARRAAGRLVLPALLFALVPASWPDLAWTLPLAFLASGLFAASLSVVSPLLVLAGFAASSEILLRMDLPAAAPGLREALAGAAGWLVALGLLLAAVAASVLLGIWKTPRPAPEIRYFTALNASEKSFRWQPVMGPVLVVFSLIGAAGLVFAFLAS